MTETKYRVKGMHCAACETLIEKTISEFNGVEKVRADLAHKEVVVSNTQGFEPLSVTKLNKKFFDLGYSFVEPGIEDERSPEEIYKIVLITAAVIGLFFLLGRLQFIPNLNVSAQSSFLRLFLFGVVASLSSCAALVGGLLLSLSNQWNEIYVGKTKDYLPFTLFNLGRLVSFAVLGFVLGMLGSYLKVSLAATSTITVLVSLIMLILGFQMLGIRVFQKIRLTTPKFISKHIVNERNFQGKYMPFVVGALTFFVPCGFTLIAQTTALETGNPIKSSTMLLAFALGTLPMLTLISFTSIKLHNNQKFSQKFSHVAGALVVFFAVYSLNSQINLYRIARPDFSLLDNTADSQVPQEKTLPKVQYLQMEAKGFAYSPKTAKLRAGVPVIWEFYNSGAYGCAQSVAAPGLVSGVLNLKPGLNTFEFTPQRRGTYKISCSMGMVAPVIVYVN